jgi:hypothetical protein
MLALITTIEDWLRVALANCSSVFL